MNFIASQGIEGNFEVFGEELFSVENCAFVSQMELMISGWANVQIMQVQGFLFGFYGDRINYRMAFRQKENGRFEKLQTTLIFDRKLDAHLSDNL